MIAPLPGADEKYWDDNSVIYAQVVKVTQLAPGEYMIQLRPQATISGRFDVGAEPTIDAIFFAGPFRSYLQTLPSVDSMVVTLLWESDNPPPRQELRGAKYVISTDALPFFPKKAVPSGFGLNPKQVEYVPHEGMFEVEGFDDPRVHHVRAEIQKIRAQGAARAPRK